MTKASEHFDDDHVHTTPGGRHFRHSDGCEVTPDTQGTRKIVVSLNRRTLTGHVELSYEELSLAEAKARLETPCDHGFYYSIPTWQFDNDDGSIPEDEKQAKQQGAYDLIASLQATS